MKNIIDCIIEYLKSENSDGAFQIKGDWGCGKTFFIKYILPEKLKDDSRIQVMISLFGIANVKEIPYRLLNAYINKLNEIEKNAEEDMERGLDYLDMKYGVDRKYSGINLHDEDELIFNIIPRDKVYLCLDDVERFIKRDNVEEVMGFINNLVENLGYKVILILNDNYKTSDVETENIKVQFKEKVIGKSMTFIRNNRDIFNSVVEIYKDAAFLAFMKRDDICELFLPARRDVSCRRDFENIRTMKFAISNFKVVFDYFKDAIGLEQNDHTVISLKYYLAFIIGVSIEYKKGNISEEDCHDINIDTELFSFDIFDDNDFLEQDVQNLFSDTENSKEEKERRDQQKKYNDIYRRRFYNIYAKDVNQSFVFHEELYNNITKGLPINFNNLIDNLNKKVFDKEKIVNPGNVIVSQTLNGSIYNYTDEEIREKLLVLIDCVKNGNLITCDAYVNAFSFLNLYKTVIGISFDELLGLFKDGFSTYISSHEIDNMEKSRLEVVAGQIPSETTEFYNFMKDELSKKWEAQYQQRYEEMRSRFNENISAFCKLFEDNAIKGFSRFTTEAVLQNIPEYMVEEKMHNLSPKEVHELAMLVENRYKPEDIYSYGLAKEKQFLLSMKKGIEWIEGEDTVSKVEAKRVLLGLVKRALKYIDIGSRKQSGQGTGQCPALSIND